MALQSGSLQTVCLTNSHLYVQKRCLQLLSVDASPKKVCACIISVRGGKLQGRAALQGAFS